MQVYGQSGKVSWLDKLNSEIYSSARYDAQKWTRIDSLQKQVNRPDKSRFEKYLDLYNEFSVFNFDSAYFYAVRLQEAAAVSKDSILIKYAKIKTDFVLLSAGMFKEVFDSLNSLNPQGLDIPAKSEYYILMARSYFDLSDYNQEKVFTDLYSSEADRYIDSLLSITPHGSFQFFYYNGLKNIRRGNVGAATQYFNKLINDTLLTMHQSAIINSTYSDLYIRKGQADSAIILLCKAAIADIRSSTKETTAILNLAALLFKSGDINNASVYIQKASEDARAYGARQRILQLSNILPLIESKRLASVQRGKENITRYAIIISFLLVFLIVLAFIVFKQVKRMRIQQKEINAKNLSLHHMVEEKEWLLKEIHHRVKNNLHTITSLLESQSAYLENDALIAIRDSQHRVFAMSLIHQKLYQPERNVTAIDMPMYLHELVDYLNDSFELRHRIKFKMDTEPIELDISLAVPVGLILNEAITNSMKYAFPLEKEGVINISIKRTGEKKYLFVVADNGIGLPEGFDINKVNSLGMKLMKGLSDDIMAKFQIENLIGTKISIEFIADKSIEHLQHVAQQS
jgi:two-component sensor histidine kinase